MSDSDKTNEIDNYGVWVKKPPRTVSSEMDNLDADLDLSSDLPDFSDLDNIDNIVDNTPFDSDDKALSADELSALANSTEITSEEAFTDSAVEEAPADPNAMEEISLDDFIEGGIFEGDDGGSAASEASEAASKQTETVSTDEFVTEDFTVDASDSEPKVSDTPAFDDGPLDIDLSFDDTPAPAASSGETTFETIDSFDSFDTASSAPAASDDGTESVDLSEFGLDFSDSSEPAAPAEESAPKVDADGMEEISLDDFGFDINAEESQPEEEKSEPAEEPAAEEESVSFDEPSAPAEEAVSTEIEDISLDDFGIDSGSDDVSPELELPKSDEIEMSVMADDDMETQEEPAQAPSQSTEEVSDDDFDLDAIMNSIEDENGNTSSLNFEEPAQSPEEALAIAETDIPDTFEEETESLFGDIDPSESLIEDADEGNSFASELDQNEILEPSEPVFEETAVDISEIPEEPVMEMEEPVASTEPVMEEPTIVEDSNPFTLPPDDAFINEPVAEEPVFEEPAAETIVEEAAFEEPVAETVTEEPSFEETAAESVTEEPAFEAPAVEETVAAQKEIVENKDSDIAAATNSILSQIVSELASLKSEISSLKNDFEELKTQEHENPLAAIPEEKDEGGFFSDDGGDDTIALSVDELDNILNTVEIVDATQEEGAVEEPAFEGNDLEEPVLNESEPEYSEEAVEEEVEEIYIPKVEDSVENASEEVAEPADNSQSEDDLSIGDFSFDDESNEIQPDAVLSDEMMETISEPEEPKADEELVLDDTLPEISENTNPEASLDEPFEFGSDTISEASIEEEPAIADEPVIEEEQSETSEEDGISISNSELDRLLAEDASINDSLTDANMSYLAEDKNIGASEETNSASSIPGNLQKEIKSVLSYMDQLLENLPEEKIAEFAQSEQFETYKKLFKELGLN